MVSVLRQRIERLREASLDPRKSKTPAISTLAQWDMLERSMLEYVGTKEDPKGSPLEILEFWSVIRETEFISLIIDIMPLVMRCDVLVRRVPPPCRTSIALTRRGSKGEDNDTRLWLPVRGVECSLQ